MTNNNTFHVGLCMAGAVSAGAYTAGVMDYLIEALDIWQKRKDAGEADVPAHKVEIPVIGGASAGGMTGIIASAAIHDPIIPVEEAPSTLLNEIKENKFYHSWVDLLGNNMLDLMLETSDIKTHGTQSALNAEFIDKIAERAVSVNSIQPVIRKYFSENLKIFVTLSNIQGMDYSVAFKSLQGDNKNRKRHLITIHNDYACFQLVKDESDYMGKGWMPLNFSKGLNVKQAAVAAMATGAFPVGLKARVLEREGKFLNDNKWFADITQKAFRPFRLTEPISTTNIDGGMINNEPFEKVQDVLIDLTGQSDPNEYRDYNRFKGTVLMIDPFPSEVDDIKLAMKYNKEKQNPNLLPVVGGTLGALIGQARVKPSILIDAWESDNAAQFLIAPVRYEGMKPIDGSKAIACGALDGFGGFISKEFRIHDYFLGRANCERFLRHHFTVPCDNTNPIFKEGYKNISEEAIKKFTAGDGSLQIIPIFTDEKNEPYLPTFSNGTHWPTVSEKFIRSYKGKLNARVQAIIMNMAKVKGLDKLLLWVGAQVVLNRKISSAVLNTILNSLDKHKLLK
jgi:hypothetical protein